MNKFCYRMAQWTIYIGSSVILYNAGVRYFNHKELVIPPPMNVFEEKKDTSLDALPRPLSEKFHNQ